MFDAYVDNIGCLGTFKVYEEAEAAVLDTIANSARADRHGFIIYEDDIIFEVGDNAD